MIELKTWGLTFLVCFVLWLMGYFFGYSVGKTAGIKEGALSMLNKIEEILKKYNKRKRRKRKGI